jgi:hypothetical protein
VVVRTDHILLKRGVVTMLNVWVGRYVAEGDIECINEDGVDAGLFLDWGVFLGTSREAVVEQMRVAFEGDMEGTGKDGCEAEATVGHDKPEGDFFECRWTDWDGEVKTERAWFRLEERLL